MTPAPHLVGACSGCDRVARANAHPAFITELRESLVFLHDHQPVPGWCVLMLKDHHEHLHALPPERQTRLSQDVADVARTIVKATGARRINYECLGNQLAHVHWHVIPRFLPPIDADPANVVWLLPPAQLSCSVSPNKQSELITALRAAGGWERT